MGGSVVGERAGDHAGEPVGLEDVEEEALAEERPEAEEDSAVAAAVGFEDAEVRGNFSVLKNIDVLRFCSNIP